jgi:cytochrome c-type biogenesis protein CcmH
MVEGLAARLEAEGGTIAEWTQLVRSRLVLGETEKAGAAYRAARLAYPDAGDRQALDVLAADHGLIAAKGAP